MPNNGDLEGIEVSKKVANEEKSCQPFQFQTLAADIQGLLSLVDRNISIKNWEHETSLASCYERYNFLNVF